VFVLALCTSKLSTMDKLVSVVNLPQQLSIYLPHKISIVRKR